MTLRFQPIKAIRKIFDAATFDREEERFVSAILEAKNRERADLQRVMIAESIDHEGNCGVILVRHVNLIIEAEAEDLRDVTSTVDPEMTRSPNRTTFRE